MGIMEIYVMHDGQQLGPFSLENVRAQLASGDLSAADYAWSADIDDLTSLGDVLSNPLHALPSDDRRQRQKRAGILRAALRQIPSVVDRQLTAKRIFAGTVLLLIASWIYPPWIVNGHSHGWFLVFDTTQTLDMRVDFGRLLLIDAIIAAAGGLLSWAAFHNWTPLRVTVRLAVYSLLAAPLIAVTCLAAILIRDRVTRTDRITFNPLPYVGAIPVVAPASPKSEYDVLLNAVATPPGQSDSEGADQFTVAPSDLKRIALFDVGVHGYKYSISGIYGRVRNGLGKAIHRIGVKALFYTAEGELIEVRTFLMKHRAGVSRDERVLPNAPISFDEHLPVDHLPPGYKCQLEVTEARYAN
jgi:hypothetical protein